MKLIVLTNSFLLFGCFFFFLTFFTYSFSEETHKKFENCIIDPHDPKPLAKAVENAKQILSTPSFQTHVPIQDRLLTMVLFSRGFHDEKNGRLEYLRCSLLKLQRNLMPNTTLDVFIWALNSTEQPIKIPSWFNSKDFPRMQIIEIPQEVWKVPCGLEPDHQWSARRYFDLDYYLMGRWRLTFSLDFAKALGYEYHLQFDDDAMLNQVVPYDLIHEFREKTYQMGVFSDHIGEVPHLTLGLPEITSYWLKIRNYQPKGSIFNHVRPHGIQGLTSDGWDRMYHPGYFLIVSVPFWFQHEIQDYLTTIYRIGRDVEGRWQEQSVMNMIRLVFIPEDLVWVMKDVDIGHDRHKRHNFENWCVKTGLITYPST